MNEILNEMRSNGFDVQSVTCDTKVHRFKVDKKDHKESGWYCAFQNHVQRTGETFYVAVFGSWRDDKVHKFQSNVSNLSAEDKVAIKRQIDGARKKAEAERKLIQADVSIQALKKWESLSSVGTTEYLTRKGVTSLHGARVIEEPFTTGLTLYVPMRDVDGKLWGLQSIFDQKLFMSGQRVQGCFHTIGDINEQETIYLTEGFATAASIYEATGKSIVVCFTASNLVHVATLLKEKYSDRTFVICGDDDTWARRPNGELWNPGREKAEEAAKRTLGTAVFPSFAKSEEGKTTDFNDLFAREGAQAVRDQILGVAVERHYIVPLGYNHGTYYLLSNVNPQIQALPASALTSSGLCRVQPLMYWEAIHPGAKGGVDWAAAADAVMQSCHARGIFRPDKVRGRGVWRDKSTIVYHMGDRLYFDSKEHELHRNKLGSAFIYEKDDAMPAPHAAPLSVEECESLLDAVSMVKWKRSEQHMLFAGWLAIAPICGALPWRPHVWLTGPSGTGKSYIMQSIINPLLGQFMHYFQGQTTEAGIRQATGCSTKPVIFDEFETNDIRSSDRIKAILELARQASSESDAIVVKGTASGDHMQFKPRFSMLVSSVRVNLVHEEDRNRFTILDLVRSGDDRVTHFEELRKFVDKLTQDYGHRLFSRMLARMPQLIKSIDTFQRVLAETHTMRFGQQCGTLLGGYHTLMSDEPVTEEQARSMAALMTKDDGKDTDSEEQDENGCLTHLLAKRVLIELDDGSRAERAVGEMIHEASKHLGAYNRPLQRLGIIVDQEHVHIMCNWPELKQLYFNTSWSGGYVVALKRIPGVVHSNKTKWFSLFSAPKKVILIPVKTIIKPE